MATALVTGGAGFIGSHLVEALLGAGYRTLVIDDLSSGRIENLAAVRANNRLEFMPESITCRSVLAELVDRADVIFHLAATVGVFNIIESPVATIENNIGGTEAVLKMAAKKKKKVVVASTSEVYGKTARVPFREDGDLVFGPTSKCRWSYACSKVIDEFLALAYWKEYRVPTVVVRLFNTIGPRQVGRYGMVVPRFLNQAISGRNLTVYGSGKQSRCFTYVADVIEWLMRLAATDKAVGEIFNIGNPEETSITELARRVIETTGADVGIDYVPYERAYEEGFEDMERRVPDITKIRQHTKYSPSFSLDEALSLTYDWHLQEAEAFQPVVQPLTMQAGAVGD
jgi:UDP-glucose 4-epimerase